MVLKGDIDKLESNASKIKTCQGIEYWMKSAKTLMRSKKYDSMKEEFLEKFRPDVGFTHVTEEDLSIVFDVIQY